MSSEQGSHARASVQPTLIVLANFEEKMTKTALLMIQ
jgi:hypothetical protein